MIMASILAISEKSLVASNKPALRMARNIAVGNMFYVGFSGVELVYFLLINIKTDNTDVLCAKALAKGKPT